MIQPLQLLIQVRNRDYLENLTPERLAALEPLGIEFCNNTAYNTVEFENKKLICGITQSMGNSVQPLQDVIDEYGFRWIILAAVNGLILNYQGEMVPNHITYYKKGVVRIYLQDPLEIEIHTEHYQGEPEFGREN